MRTLAFAITLAALVQQAAAFQTPCLAPAGPDLIVGDLTGPTNYAVDGAFDAIAIGATHCNLGTTPAAWAFATANHPVTGSALYRWTQVGGSSRFEQIGMSWVLHATNGALQQALCCSCTPTGLDHLGSGCSSASSSAIAGTQSAMGPRWQVDPRTGAFPFPADNPPFSGSSARRLRFAVADAIASGPGVRYFAELHTVHPGDAAAGNRANNASWREMSCTGGANPSFAFAGATSREQHALRAWQTADPAVVIAESSGADGEIAVGLRVTDLGGGWWNYEYALENLTYAPSVGAFEVPVGAGVAVRNVGFHDVAHHSGDGPGGVDPDGTDWTAVLGGGRLRWSTDEFALNPEANALRWGTTYNFRFDASAPPAAGAVLSTRFEPGAPLQTAFGVGVPGAAAHGAFCAGDGGATPCPCGNASPAGAGEGCLNSLGGGGRLAAGGAASLAGDTLVLIGSGMPNSSALYFQGTAQVNGGAGSVFGDGLRCAGGSVVRLATKANVGGASQYPSAGDPPVSVRGMVAASGVRVYQVWYRNAASFCQPETFNLSGGVLVNWN